jgi:hypothetical protein
MEEQDELEDPGLLAELAALGISQEPQVHTGEMTSEEVNVEFDDKDMEDPELLVNILVLMIERLACSAGTAARPVSYWRTVTGGYARSSGGYARS